MDMIMKDLLRATDKAVLLHSLHACNVGCSHLTLQFIIQLNYIFVCIIYKVMYLQICN